MTATVQNKKRLGPLALVVKLGPKLLAVFGKLAKALLLVASFAGWSLILSWKFALLLLGSIFFHEMGHVWAMRRYHMKVKGIYFLPFMGAAAVTESSMPSRFAQIVVSLMGPLWGFGLAVVTYGLYVVSGAPLFAALAGFMAMINLFNLLPINPLDGGKALNAITHSINSRLGSWCMGLGLVAAFVLAFVLHWSLLYVLIFVGAIELLSEQARVRQEAARAGVLEAVAAALGVEANTEAVCARLLAAPDDDADFSLTVGKAVDRAFGLDVGPRDPVREQEALKWCGIGTLHRGDEPVHGYYTNTHSREKLMAFLRRPSMPRMNAAQMAGSGLAYVGLAAALIALMYATKHVPGADIALQLFKD